MCVWTLGTVEFKRNYIEVSLNCRSTFSFETAKAQFKFHVVFFGEIGFFFNIFCAERARFDITHSRALVRLGIRSLSYKCDVSTRCKTCM